MTAVVFVPLDWDDAAALRSGADLGPRVGSAPTADLARMLGPEADPEEVEYAALNQAGDRAAEAGRRRLVVAADVEPGQLVEAGNGEGEVSVTGLHWRQVSALFGDDPSAVPADPADDDADLLWFAPGELDQLRPV